MKPLDQNQKPISRNVLKQIKYELKNQDKLSNDLNVDLNAIKLFSDQTCIKLSVNDYLKGIVQDQSLNPFGFLFMSQMQVNNLNELDNYNYKIYILLRSIFG
jgi:hypothetical protein